MFNQVLETLLIHATGSGVSRVNDWKLRMGASIAPVVTQKKSREM
jgi:hypothetical protein